MWRQSKLEARRVSPPTVFGQFVVVGDLEGYVHWLRKEDGQFAARVKVDSGRIVAAPVATAFAVYVYGSGGELAALQVVP
jgi:outer membrane protein assembly factor BamB